MADRETASTLPATGRVWWLPALAAGLAAAAYLNALDNPFVYDDQATILHNPSLTDPRNWRFVLVFSPFRPVVNVSYAIDRVLWGYRPFGYHLTSLGLHVLNVLLLFRFARLATRDRAARMSMAGRRSEVDDRLGPFAAAALLAVHPLMTEAVGYVSGRSEVLCGTFFLAALLLVRRGLLGGGPRWLAAGFTAFLLALASKETAVMFPFVLAAYDRLCLPGSDADRQRRLRWIHAPLVALVVVAASARLAALLVAERQVAGGPVRGILTQITVVPRYFGLLVLPVGQSLVHRVREIASPLDTTWLLSAAVVLAVLLAAWWSRRRDPLLSFGVFWFFLVLLPSSSAVALREIVAEHRLYLASAGLFLAAASALGRLARPAGREGRVAPGVWAGLLVGLALLFGLTVRRNGVWASPIALWSEAAAKAPDYWEPHYSLGDALREAGRCAEAIGEYQLVVRLRPGHVDAYNNLGICLAETGRLAEARVSLERALSLDPGFARAETNLGGLALLEHDPGRARQHFERALALEPDNIPARRQLAALFETTFGNPGEAARLCREILALAPQTPGAAECVTRNEARLPAVR